MPVHDWTRVEAGTYHSFHNAWITHLSETMNSGLLPRGYYALAEQHSLHYIADVLTLQTTGATKDSPGGVSVTDAPPKVARRLTMQPPYAMLRRTIAVRRTSGHRVVALLEILSPGNKNAHKKVQEFVDKATDAIRHGCHLLLVDPLPPTKFAPRGMHGAIWQWWYDDDFDLPKNRPLTLSSYESCRDAPVEVYLEHLAVGEVMPDMPLFLREGYYVNIPRQAAYDQAFRGLPALFRAALEKGVNGKRSRKS